MYAYTKKNKRARIYAACGSGLFLLAMVGILSMNELGKEEETATKPVVKEVDIPVISIPKAAETAIRPYQNEASIVLDFYDGSESEVDSFSQFEGVYRMNQGIDYAYQNEAFDVLAIFSGSVEEVKEDAMFGHTVKVKSDDLTITYQSLSAPTLQAGDAIKQGDVIAQAGVNIYGKDLGNHVHIVVSKGDRLIDPESIYGLAVKDIQ